MLLEVIEARGHPNITALHKTTFEITKDREVSKRGDCIIGVKATKAIEDINERLKNSLKSGNKAKITIELPDYGLKDEIVGFGDKKMTFKHKKDIVVRKSRFVCNRTLLIKANKAAYEINREIVDLLKDPATRLIFAIEVLDL